MPNELQIKTTDLENQKLLRALVRRAEHGDQQAMAELRPLVATEPEFWKPYDLARLTTLSWMSAIAGDNQVMLEALEGQTGELRQQLGWPSSSALERLLIDRIVICWLQVEYADGIYAQNMQKVNLAWGDYQQRRQDRAQQRYLAAIKALAQVRRLLVPVVQVNIGERQVNVAGPGHADGQADDAI